MTEKRSSYQRSLRKHQKSFWDRIKDFFGTVFSAFSNQDDDDIDDEELDQDEAEPTFEDDSSIEKGARLKKFLNRAILVVVILIVLVLIILFKL